MRKKRDFFLQISPFSIPLRRILPCDDPVIENFVFTNVKKFDFWFFLWSIEVFDFEILFGLLDYSSWIFSLLQLFKAKILTPGH